MTSRTNRLVLASLLLGLAGCKEVDIKTEGDKDEFRFGSVVHLWATFKDELIPAGEATVKWTSSKNGAIGDTPDITVSDLKAGKHEIEVEVRRGDKKGKKKRKITILNDSPAVTIQEPTAKKLGVGKLLALRGSATDPEDGVLTGESLSWSSSLDGALGTGASLEVSHLRPGEHELILTARDRAGAESRARVRVEITNEAPEVKIEEPSGTITIKVTDKLELRGYALDRDHRLGPERVVASSLEWRSDKDGKLGVGESLTVDQLSGGTHEITLQAKDEYGKAGEARVRVKVENEPPRVRIRRPQDDKFFSAAEDVHFEVDARDPEAELDKNDIVWRSNKDGLIGRGFEFDSDKLSEGKHEITCTVTDKHGASAKDSVTILITNEAPTAEITAPQANGSLRFSHTLLCEGRARDPEDGNLSGDRLVWTAVKLATGKSHRLGEGRTLSVGMNQIADKLGFGPFELRLVATDKDGKASPTVSVALTLENAAPTVKLSNPVAGTTVAAGQLLLCSGYGNDPDRGRLLEGDELVWRAKRLEDNTVRRLGAGTRLEVTDLAPGTYELVLVGIDPDDQTLKAEDRVRITVSPAGSTPPAAPPVGTTTSAPVPDTTGINGIVGQ